MAKEPSMQVRLFSADGYRSLRGLHFLLAPLSVFVGANGVGKTNLYRALQLIQSAAAGTLSRELAAEGGMESALWAGPRRAKELARIALKVGFGSGPDERPLYEYDLAAGIGYSYEIDVGLRRPVAAAFPFEPQIKEETLIFRHGKRSVKLLERRGPSVLARDDQGQSGAIRQELMESETALGSIEEPGHYPDLHMIRRLMLDWRFYHGIRTDAGSPLRAPCLAVTTPQLDSDGGNLAALFATLVHIRQDTVDLDRAIDDAFPGAQLIVPVPGRTASFGIIFPEHPKRVFQASELSDGTLRYLALAGALLAYRLPAFVALNEPETSLHPDLLDPLARLIARAAKRGQIWLVTHSERLAAGLAGESGVIPLQVIKRGGATWIDGLKLTGEFAGEE